MRVTVWSDYICPWAYLGTASYAAIERLGAEVVPLPFELHPEYPREGVALSRSARDRWAARFGPLLEGAGLAFTAPARVPRSRPVLEWAEAARAVAPARFRAVHQALFAAHFVQGRDLSDVAAIREVVRSAGVDADAVEAALEGPAPAAAVNTAREEATDAGVTGTPAWHLDGRFLLPGAQPPEVFERMLARLGRA